MSNAKKPAYVIVQQGGTDDEVYLHVHDTRKSAKRDRVSCSQDGAYQTSPIVRVPASLAALPEFFIVVEEIVRASRVMDMPETTAEA